MGASAMALGRGQSGGQCGHGRLLSIAWPWNSTMVANADRRRRTLGAGRRGLGVGARLATGLGGQLAALTATGVDAERVVTVKLSGSAKD
jgi:hypothetical protein